MTTSGFGRIHLCVIFVLLAGANSLSQNQFWVTGYLTSWSLNTGIHESGYGDGNLHKDSIDYDALTHIIMFAISLNDDGSIGYGNLSPGRRGPYNDYVHAKGKPIILSVGGAGNNSFANAIAPTTRTTTVRNLLSLRRSQRYDGYDIDMEPVNSSDTANLRLFIRELYDSLQRESSFYDGSRKPLLTAATYNNAGFWGRMAPYLDQINLMSYDFFGTWFGKSWHNNAPYGGPGDVDMYGAVMTTVESKMQRFLEAGIPRSKLGIGVDFNGYVWRGGIRNDGSGNGITGPRQTWSTPPTMTTGKEVTGYTITKNWIDRFPGNVRYDSVARVPYIGIDSSGFANDYFITYQDTSTAREITQLGLRENLGGMIIWELGGGYYSEEDFPGLAQRDPMLQSVKAAVGGLPPPSPPATPVPASPAHGSSGIPIDALLTWSASTGATGYDLQVSLSVQFGTTIVNATNSPQISFTLNGLSHATQYYWRVRARNSGGTSAWSSARSFTTVTAPLDTVSPQVTISAPLSGSTVSATIGILSEASDNIGVAGVRFYANGSSIGAEIASSPYRLDWNTMLVANGQYSLTAVARDHAGNSRTSDAAIITVTNAEDTTLEAPAYTDSLQNPWTNASWSSSVSFSSTERVFEGTHSIKSTANGWGALRLRSGSWSNPVSVNTALFENVEIALYNTTSGLDVNVYFENDADNSFPVARYTNLALHQWILLSIPVTQLNPERHPVHALIVQNSTSGSAIFYADEIRFVAVSNGSYVPVSPRLSSPPDGETGLPEPAALTWRPVAGAQTYDVQVATTPEFSPLVFQQSGLTDTTVMTGLLQAGLVHYWRVRGVNAAGAGPYSSSFQFRTLGVNRLLLYSTTSIDFGRVGIGQSKTDSIRLDNGGSDPISMSATSSSNAAITSWMQAPTLGSGESRYLFIRFSPTARSSIAGSLVVLHDGINSPDTIRISGRGVNPARIRTSAAVIDFGRISPGGQRAETLTVSNDGELDLELLNVVSTNPTFQASVTDRTVAAGASTSIRVLARPQSARLEQGHLLFFSTASTVPDSVLALVDGSTTIGGGSETPPDLYRLGQNYPNPFNPTTQIVFALPAESHVRLVIYNAVGQTVATLVDEVLAEGVHGRVWGGVDAGSSPVAAGVYFYRLTATSIQGETKSFTETRKMILLE